MSPGVSRETALHNCFDERQWPAFEAWVGAADPLVAKAQIVTSMLGDTEAFDATLERMSDEDAQLLVGHLSELERVVARVESSPVGHPRAPLGSGISAVGIHRKCGNEIAWRRNRSGNVAVEVSVMLVSPDADELEKMFDGLERRPGTTDRIHPAEFGWRPAYLFPLHSTWHLLADRLMYSYCVSCRIPVAIDPLKLARSSRVILRFC